MANQIMLNVQPLF